MKIRLIHIVISLALLVTSCSSGQEAEFDLLDETLDRAPFYDAANNSFTDSLRNCYYSSSDYARKWESAYELQTLFFRHNLDSCNYYSRKMLVLDEGDKEKHALGQACYASALIRQDSLEKAFGIFNQIDTTALTKGSISKWGRVGDSCYRKLAEEDDTMPSKIIELREKWWRLDSLDIDCVTRCKPSIENYLSCRVESPNDSAKFYYYLGQEYLSKNNRQKAKSCFIESAIIDVRLSAKAHNALYALADILFQERGELERARRYIKMAFEDTITSKYSTNYNKTTRALLVITDALLLQESQKERAYLIAAVSISLLFLVALLASFLLFRYSRRQAKYSNTINELSIIKERFLANYMEKCVEYLNKVDQYRSSLRKASKAGGHEAILAKLREPSFTSQELDDMLKSFDSTFLGIYPDFVEKVNAQMQDGYQFSTPEENRLSTELRMLALIRLGITKRSRIARILNLSVTTVYVYHYTIQKNSLHDRSDFDAIIAAL